MWAKARTNQARAAVEATGTPMDTTEYYRGRIAELKELLRLGNAGQQPMLPPTTHID